MNKSTTLFSSFLIVIAFILLQTSITSCTKEKIVTVNNTDTLIIKDTAISLSLLTANAWKIQEIRGVTANTVIYYKRGGSFNTNNLDVEYIAFNANKTGVYYDADGYTHQLAWEFSNTEMTKMSFIVTNPAPYPNQTVVYENLRYKNGALWFDQYWTLSNANHHAQAVRIPK